MNTTVLTDEALGKSCRHQSHIGRSGVNSSATSNNVTTTVTDYASHLVDCDKSHAKQSKKANLAKWLVGAAIVLLVAAIILTGWGAAVLAGAHVVISIAVILKFIGSTSVVAKVAAYAAVAIPTALAAVGGYMINNWCRSEAKNVDLALNGMQTANTRKYGSIQARSADQIQTSMMSINTSYEIAIDLEAYMPGNTRASYMNDYLLALSKVDDSTIKEILERGLKSPQARDHAQNLLDRINNLNKSNNDFKNAVKDALISITTDKGWESLSGIEKK
ncbi:MAG: hypothetical protein P0S95_07260 [Rhabdochlamydiaceae bacterium]|nr:hypothetical protein [Candidatus Amphrikana amoebophyrae]